jgi:hypothetical protein
MKVHGGCHCGAIRYEADVDADAVGICHCTDCQELTGTAFRVTVPAPARAFRLTAGSPRVYVKTADSGARRIQAFCSDCGSHLYATSATAHTIGIRVGTIEERRQLRPSHQIWRRSALPWVPAMEELRTFCEEDED